jgi:hypothetical protein
MIFENSFDSVLSDHVARRIISVKLQVAIFLTSMPLSLLLRKSTVAVLSPHLKWWKPCLHEEAGFS